MEARRALRFDTNEAVEIGFEGGTIRYVHPLGSSGTGESGGGLPWISPGWIDLQVNGYAGFDFNAEQVTTEDILGVTREMHKYGVTSYLPTVITGSSERMERTLLLLGRACDDSALVRSSVAGIHVEGPYLSKEDGPRGAHPLEHVREPDEREWERWQRACGGRIRLATVAPERNGAAAFIEKLASEGIVVSLGHTAATREQLEEAVLAGAVMSTHLGNGAHPVLPRHPHYIWYQLADDRLWASFIADGHHLAPEVLKAMIRAKQEKFVLVTDCVALGGLPPGRYRSNVGGEVDVLENGRIQTAQNPNILAGSGAKMTDCVANAVRYAGLPLREAVEAVTVRPAQILRRPDLGRLEPGCAADLTLFTLDADERITVRETIVKGSTVYTDHREEKPWK